MIRKKKKNPDELEIWEFDHSFRGPHNQGLHFDQILLYFLQDFMLIGNAFLNTFELGQNKNYTGLRFPDRPYFFPSDLTHLNNIFINKFVIQS